MAPLTSATSIALAAFTLLATSSATPLKARQSSSPWSVSFHTNPACSAAPFQTASGFGPTTGCATVTTSDGVTKSSAEAISVSDDGYTVVWYKDAGCQDQLPILISGNGYEGVGHCDIVENEEKASYYKVVAK